VSFTQGVAVLYQTTPGNAFAVNNLATWGIPGTPSAANASPLGVYILKAPQPPVETVTQGNATAYVSNKNGAAAAQVNFAAAPNGTTTNITGAALLRDQGTIAGNVFTPGPDVFNFAGAPVNPAFVPTFGRTINGTGAGPGTFLLPGTVFDFTDTFQSSLNAAFDITTNAANLGIANGFFATFGGDPGLVLPDGTVLPGTGLLNADFPGFATGFNTGTNFGYNPNFNNPLVNNTNTGDFPAQTSTATGIAPTLEPSAIPTVGIPEPVSMLVWGLGGGGAALFGYLRRRRNQK
jgi:hypothetical protein